MSISPPVIRRVNEGQVRAIESSPEPSHKLEIKRRYDDEIHDVSQACREPGPAAQGTHGRHGDSQRRISKSRAMIANGGLAPTANSTRVRVSNGKLTVKDGPFTEAKEMIGGFAQFELKSKEEAIEGAVRFMELHKKYWPGWEGETEIRQIFGPEDFAQCMNERSEAVAR
jgi:hypothetical protein